MTYPLHHFHTPNPKAMRTTSPMRIAMLFSRRGCMGIPLPAAACEVGQRAARLSERWPPCRCRCPSRVTSIADKAINARTLSQFGRRSLGGQHPERAGEMTLRVLHHSHGRGQSA
jgi:hypothetical protein